MFFAYQTPLRFAVIWRAVCRILQSKRPSFAIQKTAFCKVLIYKPLWRRWFKPCQGVAKRAPSAEPPLELCARYGGGYGYVQAVDAA